MCVCVCVYSVWYEWCVGSVVCVVCARVCGHCPEWKGPSKSLWPALRSWKLLAPLGSVQREDKQRQAGEEGMLPHQALDTGRWVLFPAS